MGKGDGFKPRHKGGNKWLVTIACGYNALGKPVRKSEVFHASPKKSAELQYKEACKYRDRLRAQYEEGKISAIRDVTLKDYAAEWIESYCIRKELKPSTIENYENLLRTRIIPRLGKLRLKEVTPVELNRFFNSLKREKISGTYQKAYYTLLHTILRSAVKEQRILFNPTERIEPPKKDTKESDHYTEEEAKHLAETICQKTTPLWRAYSLLALSTGMRKGETMGLNWSDIDFANGVIHIRRNLSYAKRAGGAYLSTPKTAKSLRDVPVGPVVLRVLQEWKRTQVEIRLKAGSSWATDTLHRDAVFTRSNGKRLDKDSPGQWFTRFLKQNNMRHLKLHGLRHTSATLMLSNGINIVDLSRVLGHASPEITGRIYLHGDQGRQREISDKMDASLFQNTSIL